ncbi:MAG: ATP-grasp domain-containing protein [Oscillospiraceae bacterium]
MSKLTILFPSSYYSIHKVDEDLQAEYNAVLDTGLFDVALFSYDKWFSEGKLVLEKEPDDFVRAVYRGWMMQPKSYAEFYKKLEDKRIRLVNSPQEYERFHIFPNIYPCFGDDTAKMLVYPNGKVELDEVKRTFKRFMIKDYVKSVKGTDFPKYFENNVTQEEFDKQMEIFYKYRSGLLTGGICVKEYLDLKRYGEKTNEYRVFYIANEIATVSRNSGQADYVSLPPNEMLQKYKTLESPFYTIDFAELTDGSWRVIEAGDGQVSGLSDHQDYSAFFRAVNFGLVR